MTARVRIAPPTAADEADFLAAMRASRRLHRGWLSMPQTRSYLARRFRTHVR
jgi:hypothetical protein